MKRICFIILITIAGISSIFAQEYSFPLYFEDSAGNKDTLWFGFDENATTNIDEQLGEVNIIGEPYDSSLCCFFTDAATTSGSSYIEIEYPLNPTFMTKKQYVTNYWDVFEIGIINHNWPLKIYWKENMFDGFTYGYDEWFQYSSFILTNWVPPGCWFDCGGYSEHWPNVKPYTDMQTDTSVIVYANNFVKYTTVSINDSISLLYLAFIQTTGVDDLEATDFWCFYQAENYSIQVNYHGNINQIGYCIFNMQGQLVTRSFLEANNSSTFQIPFDRFADGIYIVHLFDENTGKSIAKTKILKQ
ncbi:MAG: T9SS type A sorting domain-containing protein [Prolixibacteraceae bacterium]|nr:T9SS type A sorting domain-containing protein [Prolixibacteraceae bacterium]